MNDHPITKAEKPPGFMWVVEGHPFMERQANGQTKPVTMGSDGIAISAAGSRLFYCPLASHRLFSVATGALSNRSFGSATASPPP